MFKTGLIGRAIMASRSPWLHEAEARAQGLDLTYTLHDFDVSGRTDTDLGPHLRELAGQGYCGVNITYPFKQVVISHLDALADSADLVGAVNAVEMNGGRLIGHNTDMTGFQNSFVSGLPGAALNHVLQLGAGGAGAAVANALLTLGTKHLEIADVDDGRAAQLVTKLRRRFGTGHIANTTMDDLNTESVDGIVNTTPMGMVATPASPIDPERITANHWVADIVYFPLETEFLRIAREKGCRTLDGSGMVIAQAALAFEIFTGRGADQDRMRESFARDEMRASFAIPDGKTRADP